MDISSIDFYFRLAPAFITGCGYLAFKKAIQPLDQIHQNYAKQHDARRRRHRRRLSDLTGRSPVETISNTKAPLILSKLPVEIRQMIYYEYYRNSRFVLGREGTLPSKQTAWMHDKDWRYLREDPGMHRIYVQRGVLSLPYTCRQIYSECIEYIYSIPSFEFFGISDAFELPQVLLPQRWRALTSLLFRFDFTDFKRLVKMYRRKTNRTSDWETFWSKVEILPRLKRLEVHLDMTNEFELQLAGELFPALEIWDRVTEPILQVSNVCEYELWVPMKLPSVETYASAPFRLSWHANSRLMHLGKDGRIFECDRSTECCVLRF